MKITYRFIEIINKLVEDGIDKAKAEEITRKHYETIKRGYSRSSVRMAANVIKSLERL